MREILEKVLDPSNKTEVNLNDKGELLDVIMDKLSRFGMYMP